MANAVFAVSVSTALTFGGPQAGGVTEPYRNGLLEPMHRTGLGYMKRWVPDRARALISSALPTVLAHRLLQDQIAARNTRAGHVAFLAPFSR